MLFINLAVIVVVVSDNLIEIYTKLVLSVNDVKDKTTFPLHFGLVG